MVRMIPVMAAITGGAMWLWSSTGTSGAWGKRWASLSRSEAWARPRSSAGCVGVGLRGEEAPELWELDRLVVQTRSVLAQLEDAPDGTEVAGDEESWGGGQRPAPRTKHSILVTPGTSRTTKWWAGMAKAREPNGVTNFSDHQRGREGFGSRCSAGGKFWHWRGLWVKLGVRMRLGKRKGKHGATFWLEGSADRHRSGPPSQASSSVASELLKYPGWQVGPSCQRLLGPSAKKKKHQTANGPARCNAKWAAGLAAKDFFNILEY